MSGVTLNSLQSNIAKAMGPALAGVLLLWFGADWAFLISAAAYLFVIVALFLLRTVPVSHAQHVQGQIVRQTANAVHYIFSARGILLAIGTLVRQHDEPTDPGQRVAGDAVESRAAVR